MQVKVAVERIEFLDGISVREDSSEGILKVRMDNLEKALPGIRRPADFVAKLFEHRVRAANKTMLQAV